ncbi:MAG TPA: hypothetical protein VD867_13515, partial [Burkholderiales bacterium]|nr:hypothetical protein [Burkholderiales bacterium]
EQAGTDVDPVGEKDEATRVTLPAAAFEPKGDIRKSYSGQKISEAYKKTPAVQTFKHDGKLFTVTGMQHFGNGSRRIEADGWELIPPGQFKGPKYKNPDARSAAIEKDATLRGNYAGLMVTVRGAPMVMSYNKVIFDNGEPRQIEDTTPMRDAMDDEIDEDIEDGVLEAEPAAGTTADGFPARGRGDDGGADTWQQINGIGLGDVVRAKDRKEGEVKLLFTAHGKKGGKAVSRARILFKPEGKEAYEQHHDVKNLTRISGPVANPDASDLFGGEPTTAAAAAAAQEDPLRKLTGYELFQRIKVARMEQSPELPALEAEDARREALKDSRNPNQSGIAEHLGIMRDSGIANMQGGSGVSYNYDLAANESHTFTEDEIDTIVFTLKRKLPAILDKADELTKRVEKATDAQLLAMLKEPVAIAPRGKYDKAEVFGSVAENRILSSIVTGAMKKKRGDTKRLGEVLEAGNLYDDAGLHYYAGDYRRGIAAKPPARRERSRAGVQHEYTRESARAEAARNIDEARAKGKIHGFALNGKPWAPITRPVMTLDQLRAWVNQTTSSVDRIKPAAAPDLELNAPAAASPDDDAIAQAKADLNDALGDLGDIFNPRNNIVPDEQNVLPVLSRVMDAAFRLGYHSFKKASKFVLDTIRQKLGSDVANAITLDHLQGAYIAMSGKYRDKGADSKRDVVAVEDLAEIEAEQADP